MVARCALSGLHAFPPNRTIITNKSATFNHLRYDCFLQPIFQLKTMTKTTQGLSPSLILLMSIATDLAVASAVRAAAQQTPSHVTFHGYRPAPLAAIVTAAQKPAMPPACCF